METTPSFTAFSEFTRIAAGDLESVLRQCKEVRDSGTSTPILMFDDHTGRQVDFDLSGSIEDVLARSIPQEAPKGRGRPKLGVKCGEICLLPRHWDWLATQPRSASATIRRLIDTARKNETPQERSSRRLAATGTLMWAIGGDLEHFEEASRALYARKWSVFDALTEGWPDDLKEYLRTMTGPIRDALDESSAR